MKTRDYDIIVDGKSYRVQAATFYAACKRAAIAHYGKVDTIYVGRHSRYNTDKAKGKTLLGYIVTKDFVEIKRWLHNVYGYMAKVACENGWFQVGGELALTYDDCVGNLIDNYGEPAIIDIVEQGTVYYKYKLCFDVIKLKV